MICHIESLLHLLGFDERRGRHPQSLIGHQGGDDLGAVGGAVEDLLDRNGTGIGINPDGHGMVSCSESGWKTRAGMLTQASPSRHGAESAPPLV